MAGLSRKEREYLREHFGGRVTFDRTERMLYGHDIASVPKLLKPLIGGTTPRAVVQPSDEAELVELVTWAYGRGIPLTARGKATSGYGGALPLKKGLVVDFYRMRDVVEISLENLTATVEPGITWGYQVTNTTSDCIVHDYCHVTHRDGETACMAEYFHS